MKLFQKLGLYGKRTFFFLLTNFLIVITLSLVVSVVFPYLGLPMEGMNFLLIIYSLIGMGGAFINLWMSKFLVVRAMGVKILTPQGHTHQELIQKVHFLSKKAGLARMPEVGIYDSPDVNAFATGPSRNNSLVAVSSGLLRQMDDQETEGVLAHEVAHIANGDMVTMTLIMGVVNTMVMIIAHLLASAVEQALSRGRQGGGSFFFHWMLRSLFQSLLYIPGSMLVCFFSRWREYRADRGGAIYAGRHKMQAALQKLQVLTQKGTPFPREASGQDSYSYFKINPAQRRPSRWTYLFSSHPPLQDRIQRLNRPFYS